MISGIKKATLLALLLVSFSASAQQAEATSGTIGGVSVTTAVAIGVLGLATLVVISNDDDDVVSEKDLTPTPPTPPTPTTTTTTTTTTN